MVLFYRHIENGSLVDGSFSKYYLLRVDLTVTEIISNYLSFTMEKSWKLTLI